MITSNNLSRRIRSGSTKDELHKLTQTCNLLLDRLQDSFVIQRRFISNASHELSTPLTSVSSQLDVALQKDRSAQEYKETIESIRDDVKDLQQLTQSLLDIAKTGSEGSIELMEVRIDEILMKVTADVQKLKDKYSITMEFETFPEDEKLLIVFGNANLLYIALKNIIENGCKYSENHSAEIKASFENGNILIKVKSKGDIISEADIQNIFQPFFRTESAKQKEGSGLGLTLTKRIISLHKGSIVVGSNASDGTVFTIQFPTMQKFI